MPSDGGCDCGSATPVTPAPSIRQSSNMQEAALWGTAAVSGPWATSSHGLRLPVAEAFPHAKPFSTTEQKPHASIVLSRGNRFDA